MTYVPQDHEHAPKVAATPARQGRWGRHVLWVLIASTILAAVALFAAWGWRSDDLQRTENAETARVASTPTTTTPQPAEVKQGVPDNAAGTFGSEEARRR